MLLGLTGCGHNEAPILRTTAYKAPKIILADGTMYYACHDTIEVQESVSGVQAGEPAYTVKFITFLHEDVVLQGVRRLRISGGTVTEGLDGEALTMILSKLYECY